MSDYFETIVIGNKTYYLVFEVMKRANGDLLTLISKPLNEKEKMKIISEILSAIKYAHKMNICHLDLKPGNILNFNGSTKISDWGSAKRKYLPSTMSITIKGLDMTLMFTPPEIRQDQKKFNLFKADIYAFGILCCLIIQGCDDEQFKLMLRSLGGTFLKKAYDLTLQEILEEIKKKNIVPIEIIETLKFMLAYENSQRYTIDQVEKGFSKQILGFSINQSDLENGKN